MSSFRKADLTAGSIPLHLFRLSVPMLWGILSVVVMQITDIYFISRLGDGPLAAVSFTFPVSMGMFHLIIGMGIATSSVASRLMGAGEFHALHRFLFHALLMAGVVGFVLTLFGLAVMGPLFRLMGAEPAHMGLILTYMSISLWGTVFVTVPVVGNAALRAGGDSLTPSTIMISAAGLNAFLAWALVFGHAGFPALGVAGAALATLLSNAFALILGLYVLVVRRKMIGRKDARLMGFRASFKRLIVIALPVGLSNLVPQLVSGFLTSLFALSGAAAVAGFGIIGRIEAFSLVPLMALSVGLGPIAGQNFGARKFGRVEDALRTAISFSLLWSVVAAAGAALFAQPIGLSFTDHPQTLKVVSLYLFVVPISLGIGSLAMFWGSLWAAVGQGRTTFTLNIIKTLIGLSLFALIGHALAGWQGMIAGISVHHLFFGVALHFYSAQKWRRLKASSP